MASPVEEIKSRLDLVEFIQSYIRLQKAGINYKAICPFHTEKTPSFFVSPARQIWHCFGGCQKGGDVFKFVMEVEGLDFPEALRLLAQRAGVVLRREDPSLRSERNRMYDLCETATEIFEKSLALTPAAKNYLQKRGLAENTIKDFRIGFAPQSWDYLLKALKAKGFKTEEIEKAGLVVKSEDGSSSYDRFRSRIMFPIADTNGRVVGFSGRIFEEVPTRSAVGTPTSGPKDRSIGAKYVNTPNTLIYDKSRIMYGFDKAKNEIRSKNQVVVVEGQMDLIMSHQAGTKNTVAVSGTALTAQQLKTIRRLCDTLVSSFDTDAAGDSATKRSLALAAELEFNRKIAAIPSGKDPADTILENPALWQKAVEEARPVVDFYFEKAMREFNPQTVDGKKSISSLLLPYIAELTNEIEKAHWVRELSSRLAIAEEMVWKELSRKKNQQSYRALEEQPVERTPSSRKEILEDRLLALLAIAEKEMTDRALAKWQVTFSSSEKQELFLLLTSAVSLPPPHIKEKAEILRLKGEILAGLTQDLEKELSSSLRELEKERVREELKSLNTEIVGREKEGNQAMVASLLENFRNLSQKLREI